MQGLLLGLANGTACVTYCAPVLVPHILSQGRGIKANYILLIQYLIGRLAGYLIFAVIAWRIGGLLSLSGPYREIIVGTTYLVLALLLVYQSIEKKGHSCPTAKVKGFLGKMNIKNQNATTVLLGFFTGLNLCPPFMLAITGAAAAGSLIGSVLFFILFFIGTSVYFIPIPLLGKLDGSAVRMVGKMTSVIVACYYALSGLMMIIGGIRIL